MKLCLRCNQYFEDGIELCPIDTSQLEAVGDHPLIGALINDRYVVDSVIGKGSTGIVYKATRLLMGTEVAVKVLHSYLGAETGALDRFLREARAASRLRHPHIINIWEFGATDDGQPYFVMDYLEGMTLADLIKQKGALHPMKMMPIIRQVCEALAEAHKQSIIHRDMKPENVVLQETDYAQGQDFVKVLDFGIADQPAGQGGQKRAKMAAGSPAYMSPEQCQGFELDHRSDIYSLGIVVYEMLTGQRPFAADDVMALFYQHVSKPPAAMSSVREDLAQAFTPQLEAAVAKALSKKPENRQQTIKEFQRELEEACKGEAAPSKKVDSIKVDLFSVPLGEMLTGESMTNTGGSKFLPGPEEWLDQSEPARRSGSENAPVGSSGKPPVAPVSDNSSPAKAKPEQSASEAKQDYQAAVDRLLKSAKKASQAAMQTPAAPAAETPEVSNWAREVLTRSDATKSGTELPGLPTTEPEKPASPAPEPKPAEPKPAEPVNPTAAKPADQAFPPEGPEVTTWAQRVLSRTSETNVPEGEMPNKPFDAAPNMPPQPAGDAAKKAAPSALPEDDWGDRVNTVDMSVARPADSLRSSTELRLPPELLSPSGAGQKPADAIKDKSDEASQTPRSDAPQRATPAVPAKPAGALPIKTVVAPGDKPPAESGKPVPKPTAMGEIAKTGAAPQTTKPVVAGQTKPPGAPGAPAARPLAPSEQIPAGRPPVTGPSTSITGIPPAGRAPVTGQGTSNTGMPASTAPAPTTLTPPANRQVAPAKPAGSVSKTGMPPTGGPTSAAPSASASGIPPAAKPAIQAPSSSASGIPPAAKPVLPAPSTSTAGMPPSVRPAVPGQGQSAAQAGLAAARPVAPAESTSKTGMPAADLPAPATPSSSQTGMPPSDRPAASTSQSGMAPAQPAAPFDASQLDAIKAPVFDASELDSIKAPSTTTPSASHTGMAAAEPPAPRAGLGQSLLKRAAGPTASRTGMQPASGASAEKPSAFDPSQLDAIKPRSLDAAQLDAIKAPAVDASNLDAIKSPGGFELSQLNSIKSPSNKPFVQPPSGKEGKTEPPAKPIRPIEKKNSIAQAAERLLGSFLGGDKNKDKEKKAASQEKDSAKVPGQPATPGIAASASAPSSGSPFGSVPQAPLSSPFGGVPQAPSFDMNKKPEPFEVSSAAGGGIEAKPEPQNHKIAAAQAPDVSPFASAIDKMLDEASLVPPVKSDYSRPAPVLLKPDDAPANPASMKPAAAPTRPDVSQPSPPLPAAAANKEPDVKRFSEPVNRATEALNPFANAVESMLDARILPQRPLDKEPPAALAKTPEKPTRGSDVLSPFDQKPPVEPSRETSKLTFDPERFEAAAKGAADAVAKAASDTAKSASEDAVRAAAEARAEVAARAAQQAASRSSLDPKRFEEPINRGAMESSRFDAEVNKALEPFSFGKAGVDPKRLEEAISKAPIEPRQPEEAAAKSPLDPGRFDQPVNKGMLEASAIDSAVDRALEPAKDALRSTFDARRFEEPVNKGSLAEPSRFDSAIEKALAQTAKVEPAAPKPDTKRFEEPINKAALDAMNAPTTPRTSNINPFADKPKETASQEKPTLDPKRFDQPVNKGSEAYNPFAQAVDTLLDSAIIKQDASKPGTSAHPADAAKPATPIPQASAPVPPAPKRDVVLPHANLGLSAFSAKSQEETGMISPAMLKAEQAAERARMVSTPPASTPPPPAPSAPTAPAAAAAGTAPGGEQSEERISEAVTRLIEAAKRAPEPSVAAPGKPEALNRKIEAVKKKIEALKSGAAPSADVRAGATPGSTEPPVRPLPADPNSLTEAVNKLLEAAQTQSGIYQNLTQQQQQAAAAAKDPSMQNLSVMHKASEVGSPQVARTPAPAPDMNVESSAAAQSESMTRAHELINHALKSQRNQTEAQDYYSGYRTSDKPITQDRTTRSDQRRKDRARLRQAKSGGGFFKALWMIFLVVAAGAALCYTLHYDPRELLTHQQPISFEDFIKAGRFEDARTVLDKKSKNLKITPADQDKLYDQYVLLAKKEAAAKKYAEAVITLNRLPHRAARSKSADRLIRKYQKAQAEADSASPSGSSTGTSGN